MQLLSYAEAEGQAWSHLIFAGLNEEEWPALDEELAFVRDQEIDEFNRQNKILNRRAVKRGRHGEGQWSVRESKTLLLGTNERRQIRRRQLSNLIESATHGIGVTANLYSESTPSRIANPSELFSRLYFSARDEGLAQPTLHGLEKQTGTGWRIGRRSTRKRSIPSASAERAMPTKRVGNRAPRANTSLRSVHPERADLPARDRMGTGGPMAGYTWMKLFLGVEADKERKHLGHRDRQVGA